MFFPKCALLSDSEVFWFHVSYEDLVSWKQVIEKRRSNERVKPCLIVCYFTKISIF